jgi:hypothetical protein
MAVYGTLSEFNLAVGSEVRSSWDEYCERLTQYFWANDIDPTNDGTLGRRRAIFLSSVGAETYSLIRTLSLPTRPEELTLVQLQKLVRDHIAPAPVVIAERFKFYNRSQLSTESAAEFLKELRYLAGTCEFDTHRDEAIRDMFVIKLKDRTAQEKLLGVTNLTLEKAFQVAQAHERAKFHVEQMSTEVHKMSMQKVQNKQSMTKPKNTNGKPRESRPCFICGDTSHWKAECPNRGGNSKKGENTHSKNKFRYKKSKVKALAEGQTHTTAQSESSDDSDGEYYSKAVRMSKVRSGVAQLTVKATRKVPEIMVNVKIDGKSVDMELDTGASVTLMSCDQFKKFRRGSELSLTKSNMVLSTITGQQLEVVGECCVDVVYKDQKVKNLVLYVVESEGPPLLGRDWLRRIRLDWPEIKLVSDNNGESRAEQLKRKFHSLFDGKLGLVQGVQAHLEMKEAAVPKFLKPRTVPFAIKEDIAEELDRLINSGVLVKVDYSDWAAPIVPVKKPNGKYRICGDYSVTINKFLKVPEHPMPKISELLTKLNGGQSFSKLDLSQAYQQIPLDDESQRLVTINTHLGLYTYTRVPYGISAAPSLFQSIMDKVLQGVDCGCYLDDIVVTGRTRREHEKNLELVLSRLQKYGFKLQKTKCEFFQPSIKYLGLLVDKTGTKIDEEGTRAVREAPMPRNKDELRSFLGLVNHYRKFVGGMSTISRPLNRLLEKHQRWDWSAECSKAVQKIKDCLVKKDGLLTHYDPKAELVLAVDASPVGLGAVLSHNTDSGEKPIEFASRSLTAAERNYSQIDREALAIVFGVRKFHQYLYGRRFTLCTDNKPLSHILSLKKGIPSMAAARIQRWAIELAAYTFEVRHRAGKRNENADALSRLPLESVDTLYDTTELETEANQINKLAVESMPITAKKIAHATRTDEVLSRVLQFTRIGWPTAVDRSLEKFFSKRMEISVEQDVLLWGTRVIVPRKFQESLLELLHDNHPGIVRMKALARLHFWWPGLDTSIEAKVTGCKACQSSQSSPNRTQNSWAWPNVPWSRVHIDFAQLGEEHYLIMVDSHSKWPEVIHMQKGTSAKFTIEAMREVFGRLGLPTEICSDNGPPFPSKELVSFLADNGIKHILSAPYHPSSNGEAERFVRTFKNAMRVNSEILSRNLRLQEFLLHYRTVPHSTTGKTPSEMVMGRRLRTKLDLVKPDLGAAILHKNPGTLHPRTIEVGERVLVKDFRGRGQKWTEGVIIESLTPVTYRVEVLSEGLFWKRHIDQLRAIGVIEEPEAKLDDLSASRCFPVSDIIPQQVPKENTMESQHLPNSGVRAPVSPRPCVAVEEAADVGAPRRSSRTRRPPSYLTDYEP